MGLEVGWYIRLSKAKVIEALVTDRGAEQITHHVGPDFGWRLEILPHVTASGAQPGEKLVRLTRTPKPKPLAKVLGR